MAFSFTGTNNGVEFDPSAIRLGDTQVLKLILDGTVIYDSEYIPPGDFPLNRDFFDDADNWMYGTDPENTTGSATADSDGVLLDGSYAFLELPVTIDSNEHFGVSYMARLRTDSGNFAVSLDYNDIVSSPGGLTGFQSMVEANTDGTEVTLILSAYLYDDSESAIGSYNVDSYVAKIPLDAPINDGVVGFSWQPGYEYATLYVFDFGNGVSYYRHCLVEGDMIGFIAQYVHTYVDSVDSDDRIQRLYVDADTLSPEDAESLMVSWGYIGDSLVEIGGHGVELTFPYEMVFADESEWPGWEFWDPAEGDWFDTPVLDGGAVASSSMGLTSANRISGPVTAIMAIKGLTGFLRSELALSYWGDLDGADMYMQTYASASLLRATASVYAADYDTYEWIRSTYAGPAMADPEDDYLYVAFSWDEFAAKAKMYIYIEKTGEGYWQELTNPPLAVDLGFGDGFGFQNVSINGRAKYTYGDENAGAQAFRVKAIYLDNTALSESAIRGVISNWGYSGITAAEEWVDPPEISTFPYEIDAVADPEVPGWEGEGKPVMVVENFGLNDSSLLWVPERSGAFSAVIAYRFEQDVPPIEEESYYAALFIRGYDTVNNLEYYVNMSTSGSVESSYCDTALEIGAYNVPDWDSAFRWQSSQSVYVTPPLEGYLAITYNGTNEFNLYQYSLEDGYSWTIPTSAISGFTGFLVNVINTFAITHYPYPHNAGVSNVFYDQSVVAESDIRTLITGWNGYTGGAAVPI